MISLDGAGAGLRPAELSNLSRLSFTCRDFKASEVRVGRARFTFTL